jgi:hypothetical protein
MKSPPLPNEIIPAKRNGSNMTNKLLLAAIALGFWANAAIWLAANRDLRHDLKQIRRS